MDKPRNKPSILAAGVLILFIICSLQQAHASSASCESLPDGQIRWIVPFSPGGGSDTYSRLLEPHLESKLNRSVLIDNITGAGGLIGAKALRDAPADGLTIGVINFGGLILAESLELNDAPKPMSEFSIIGRITEQQHVWVTGQASSIKRIEDIRGAANKYVMGYQDVGSSSYIASEVAADIANLDLEFVRGYKGSKGRLLAIQRGELDLSAAPFETNLAAIESGEVRPILQLSLKPINSHLSLNGIPTLGDIAADLAKSQGRSTEESIRSVATVSQLLGAVPVMVGPSDLPEPVLDCWRSTFDEIISSPDLIESVVAARRSLKPLSGVDMESLMLSISRDALPIAEKIKNESSKVK